MILSGQENYFKILVALPNRLSKLYMFLIYQICKRENTRASCANTVILYVGE